MKRFALFSRYVFLSIYLLTIHLFAGLFVYENALKKYFDTNSAENVTILDPTEKVSVPTPLPVPSIFAEPEPSPDPNVNQSAVANSVRSQSEFTDAAGQIMIPVLGVKREQITDTFNDSRSSGRVHNASDIMAAGGTPVIAVDDGEIAKFFDSERGGITIYQYSPDKRRVYYYAHLQKRADNLKETDFVKKGTVIGFVGDTGNSGVGNYHLHFSITVLDDPKNVFKGTEINPFPLLKNGIEAR